MTVSTDVIVGYSVGQSLVGAIDVDFSKHNKTLILGLQEGCEFCEASMPLYERIISERNRLMADTHVVVVAPKRNDHIDVYLKDKGVAPDQIVYIEPNSSLHLKVTPTLLVVDRRGVIVETKAGFLAEGVSDQFVKSVTQS
jgi:hypothetical protein